jgi:hypothetical protein
MGISLFALFFILAASNYPGGSNLNPNSIGYNWSENYWCELLGTYSKNHSINSAQPFAMAGMISLTLGMYAFWLGIAQCLFKQGLKRNFVRYTGIISMTFSSFIFTKYHDIFIGIAVVSGLVAFIIVIEATRKKKMYLAYLWGYIFISLIIANCFIYITDIGETGLAMLQKLTFILTLSWILYISSKILTNESSI